jgi:serine/threonine protein kinase
VLGIATPKPSAYIELYKGKLIWQSYLVTEYVKGQNFYYFLRDDKTKDQRRLNAIQQVEDLLDKMGKYRITHGDLKHTNILITEDGPVLTDLDGIKVHRCNWTHKIRHTKDLQRFDKCRLGSTTNFIHS